MSRTLITQPRTGSDDMFVKEYFPVSTLVPAILEIYQNLRERMDEIMVTTI
jgi:hypothetical protein